MCLAVPFRLKTIEGTEAVAERDGVSRKIRVDFIADPKAGEYVLVHAGFAIERVEAPQAEADLQTARELQTELQKISQEIASRYESRNRQRQVMHEKPVPYNKAGEMT